MQRMTTMVLAVLLGLFPAAAAMADEVFTVDERKVGLSYRQVGETLKVSGKVVGGAPCRQLNVDIFFDNKGDSATAHVEAPMKNYKGGKSFDAATSVYIDKKHRRDWYVSDIYLKCLN